MNSIRYARHHALPDFGEQAQHRLARSRVLLVGIGGLGCASAAYLAASGVGHLVLADFDSVDEANLQRQILFRTRDLGTAKVHAAADRLGELNPEIRVQPLELRLDEETLQREAAAADVIVDGSDNFPTRFMSNRAAVTTNTPLVSGAAIRWQGQVAVFHPGAQHGGCYACLFEEEAVHEDMGSCAANGVLSPLVGVIGSMQAVETLKLLSGEGSSLHGRLLGYDAHAGRWRESRFQRDPDCPVCGEHA